MELILVLSLFVTLGVLALHYGHDSRESVRSKEQELAAYGVTWDQSDYQQPPASET